MTLKPLADHIVIKKDEPKETTKGGIILTNAAKEKPMVATVIAVGPGKKHGAEEAEPMPVKVGDRVLTNKYSGTEIKLEDEVVSVVSLSDILAIVEE
jgi:chaperonin GroES